MTDKEQILNLKDGQSYIVPESDYGKAEIWLKNERYFLFSIPIYGGVPSFEKAFDKTRVDDLVAMYSSWT